MTRLVSRYALSLIPALTLILSPVNAHAAQPPKPQLQVLSYAIAAELDPAGHKISAQAQLTESVGTALPEAAVVSHGSPP